MADTTTNVPTAPTSTGRAALTPLQALDILIQAVRLAQGKGAFSLEEAALLSEAVDVFKTAAQNQTPPTPPTAPATPEVPQN